MFEYERPLLVRVTPNTCIVRTKRCAGLFTFEATMRVMTVAAAHLAFKDLVMEWF